MWVLVFEQKFYSNLITSTVFICWYVEGIFRKRLVFFAVVLIGSLLPLPPVANTVTMPFPSLSLSLSLSSVEVSFSLKSAGRVGGGGVVAKSFDSIYPGLCVPPWWLGF
jgi:hypothetical protein